MAASKSQETPTSPDQSMARKKRIKKRPFMVKQFFKAILEDNVAVLKEFQFSQDDLNSVDMYGWSGIMMASSAGSEECVRFLLENNADISIEDKSKNNALSLARKENHQQIVEMIESYMEKRRQLMAQDVIGIDDDAPEHNGEPKNSMFNCVACKRSFNETTIKEHLCSIVHKLNDQSDFQLSKRYHIPDSNVGFQLMVKQGWNREQGLGPAHNIGPSFPVKTTFRQNRNGLGTKQDVARITHFNAFDCDAVKGRRPAPLSQRRIDTKRDLIRKARRDKLKEKRLRQQLS